MCPALRKEDKAGLRDYGMTRKYASPFQTQQLESVSDHRRIHPHNRYNSPYTSEHSLLTRAHVALPRLFRCFSVTDRFRLF